MKTKGWISHKYYHTISNRKWTFAAPCKNTTNKDKTGYLRLNYATDTQIYRFTKVKSISNPFDRDWQQYFEEREGEKMLFSSKGRNGLIKLWKSQNKLCPICGKKITVETDYKLHFKENGKQMLHPGCHNKVHDIDLSVELAL